MDETAIGRVQEHGLTCGLGRRINLTEIKIE